MSATTLIRWNRTTLFPTVVGLGMGFVLSTLAIAQDSISDKPIDFGKQVRPILNRACVSCHGSIKQSGGISFIYREQALAEGDSGEATLVPGKPSESEFVRRITSDDEFERMPPPEEHPEGLKPAEIKLLTEWVRQGAKWSDHWSFVKPARQGLPKLKTPSWVRSRSDHFVLSQLEAMELSPSPAAPATQWLRRAAFDLTGLPPTLDELNQFLKDHERDPEAAYERQVTHLLDSPHFGERWAQMWMDLVRYADTQGYENDLPRTVWPYRDWLIRAFNDDMPFDQFTIKQIAGDLLPQSSSDDLVATVCHRNTQTNVEGGTDDEEFRVSAVIDRINTTWTVWHGLTFGCAQCHNHPYDPFRQDEFYRFMAFYNNTEDCDLNTDFPLFAYPKKHEQREDAYALHKEITSLREELNAPGFDLAQAADHSWRQLKNLSARTTHGKISVTEHGQLRASGTPFGSMRTDVTFDAQSITAFRLRILPDDDDPATGPDRGAVVTHISVTATVKDGSETKIPIAEVFADSLVGPYDPMDAIKENARGFGGYPKLFGPRWAVFVLKEPAALADAKTLTISFRNAAITTGRQFTPVRNLAFDLSDDPRWTTLVSAEDHQKGWEEHGELVRKQKSIPSVRIPVMAERSSRGQRETRTFVRGNWLDKKDLVSAGFPKTLHTLPSESPDRLAMAKWLVSPDNPLTARVFVNRIWSELFGTGIVATLEDFGSSGQAPSHPALLDDLAVRFQTDMKWSVKQLLREIVLSSAYRQNHRVTSGSLEKDPQNRLLSRGPRTRLSAEMVRDQALAVSGLLTKKQFGPPVMPPQPQGVWEGAFGRRKWVEARGEDRTRRAIYTYWKRTSPYPGFVTFDAPAREVCSPRRITTNTPLQALVTLNDPVYLECAQALARRMDELGGKPLTNKIKVGYRLITLVPPDEATIAELSALYEDSVRRAEKCTRKRTNWSVTSGARANDSGQRDSESGCCHDEIGSQTEPTPQTPHFQQNK